MPWLPLTKVLQRTVCFWLYIWQSRMSSHMSDGVRCQTMAKHALDTFDNFWPHLIASDSFSSLLTTSDHLIVSRTVLPWQHLKIIYCFWSSSDNLVLASDAHPVPCDCYYDEICPDYTWPIMSHLTSSDFIWLHLTASVLQLTKTYDTLRNRRGACVMLRRHVASMLVGKLRIELKSG